LEYNLKSIVAMLLKITHFKNSVLYLFRNTGVTLVFLVAAFGHCDGQAHVQTTTLFQTTTATTISSTFASPSTTGNLIVVHIDWDGQSRTVSAVSDNKGNSYARINGTTNWNGINYAAELWYAYNITGGGGAITVKATLSGAPTTFSQIYISEYSGIVSIANPLDQNSVSTGNSLAVSSGSKTTLYNHELIYGASIGASGTLTTGAGFTNRSTANSNIIEDKNAAAGGVFDANFTSAGGNWVAQMATFISTSSSIILPVDLLTFTGHCNNNTITLAWSTSTETNNDYFTVERSEDGFAWTGIGTVKSEGNSSIIQYYSYTSDETKNEISYFRLKQTDLNGKSEYFKTIQVGNCSGKSAGVNIYPNPSNGISLYGTIQLPANEPYSVEIYDYSGNVVSRLSSSQPGFTINFSHILPSGVYYARFYSTDFSAVKSFLVRR
jgi:hypothetical protein